MQKKRAAKKPQPKQAPAPPPSRFQERRILSVAPHAVCNAIFFQMDRIRDDQLGCEDNWKLTPDGRQGATEMMQLLQILRALSDGIPVLIDPELAVKKSE